ncbi:sterol desaturase family protein [Algoriphagus zhangzhouensis]|uniref:Sterol desaturase/sphingolipid hydroxylase, fatty acid hydroxylase superfamily n=1 Tax=Algoriphagus zhangzhouensis TaxID=1073327 RepID=A0A1M7ZGD9_9BACT|nr:sterol desaturase family protein [Algoriphagus zhangzhouensis]TDY44765.1 sterol desaturase/sphingolipid hydroxylase (fatty acid hydroxylase superfamily) [Algoriphagus zhangzhouensis]SHO63943.1 Sterol desaturase/sphingolipid hydroxylase, fatty acid hydroxylase superfamily [Algoriphagus zhangzhouensis]
MKKIGRLDRPDNFGSAQMFQNPILEKISRTHISIPITMFLVLSAISFYYALGTSINLGMGLLVLFIGYIAFTLVEYLMHKYFFHMEPNTPIKDKLQYTVHGVHHDYPKDKDRLAMPPFVSAAYAAIFYLVFKLIMGDFALYFLPGFLIGYASYLGVHYIVHAFNPPKNFLKILWVNHAIHHYKDPDKAFGVSTPLWDMILGTMPKKD